MVLNKSFVTTIPNGSHKGSKWKIPRPIYLFGITHESNLTSTKIKQRKYNKNRINTQTVTQRDASPFLKDFDFKFSILKNPW